MIQEIAKDLEPIVTAQKEAAKGMYIQRTNKIIYQREPDLRTGEYLLNQIAGKPKESLEVSGGIKLGLDVL